ncbi:CHAT domain-containing protein [Halomonas sp. TRM85114]|uniref:CHAT domain-containing protein n=1 Tax=Halomonas jincaotanensis TaxID=2810616 RepID=UPI001BD602AB|nr:CHAT domain-containing protein [Halomonas jincaotanensis]MBS9405439.1 CHAT domain-containing protein [Halomonas jincaotanensis]
MTAVDTWLEAALDRQGTALAALIAGLPISSSQQQAIQLAATPELESRVYALLMVAQEHAVGGEPQAALVLALAGMQFCMSCYDRYGPGMADSFVFGVGQFADAAQRTYDRLDRHQEQVTIIDQAIAWLQANGVSRQDMTDLRFLRIEALIECGSLEQAGVALASEVAQGGKAHHLYGLLKQRLDERLRENTELPDRRSAEQRASQERKQALFTTITSLTSIAPRFDAMFDQLRERLEEESASLSPKDVINRANHTYEQLAAFMEQQAGGGGGQYQLNATTQRVSAVLADEQHGKDPAQLQQARQTLEQVRQQALAQGFTDMVEDTLWPLYLCHKRLGDQQPAVATLQAIREHIRQHRERIANPLKRAGIDQKYPHLFVELCAQLIEVGDHQELLSVIEEAKGRALADKLAIEAHREDLPWPSGPAGQWLPKHMATLGAHYLTYLTDNDRTYAVLVGKDGSLHAGVVQIGEKALCRLRRNLDPSPWGKSNSIFGRHPDDIPQRLAPLLSWLEPLAEAGLLQAGDHLCYAPEGLLHLVPFQYIAFRGAPFVALCSLSRCHCAAMLWHVTRQPAVTPRDSVAVTVPTIQEMAKYPDKVMQMSRVPQWLSEHQGAIVLQHTDADLSSVARQQLRGSIVHFATHGYFPDHQIPEDNNPYRVSGLLLAHNGHLPDDGAKGVRLTPERVLEPGSPFNFAGTHVTLQACVSGLSEEGVGGDALGLEWSLLMAGACSILSTHWNVDVGTSADFSIRFYDNWLRKGRSRASAWREAMLSLMEKTAPFKGANAYHWAPFSLSGDWR